MKKTTLLAYRNNETWQVLQDAVQAVAASKAAKSGSELLVKIFEPTDGPDAIDTWIDSIRLECEVVYTVADGTVGTRLLKKGFEFNYENHRSLNDYLDIQYMEELSMSLEDVNRTAYLRISEAVKPDLWVIVTNNLTDYDIFKIMGSEKYNDDVSDAERAAYVEKFKSLIPVGQTVQVFPYSGWYNPTSTFNREAIRGKKVVIICHHHASQHFDPPALDGTLEGSLCLDTYPSSFLKSVSHLIRTDDIIGGDVLGTIRKRLIKSAQPVKSGDFD